MDRKRFKLLLPRVILLTAFKTPSFEKYLKQFDIHDCYEKPIELESLGAILQ